jgi:hypothetical protein
VSTNTAVVSPDREPRCRYLRRDGNRCVNPVLDPDEKAVQICGKHAARVLRLVSEARERRLSGEAS